jgi:hypothetical protein
LQFPKALAASVAGHGDLDLKAVERGYRVLFTTAILAGEFIPDT